MIIHVHLPQLLIPIFLVNICWCYIFVSCKMVESTTTAPTATSKYLSSLTLNKAYRDFCSNNITTQLRSKISDRNLLDLFKIYKSCHVTQLESSSSNSINNSDGKSNNNNEITLNTLCLLLEAANLFTDSQDVLIISSMDKLITTKLLNKCQIKHSLMHVWPLPKYYDMGYISRELLLWRYNKNIKKYILFCSFACSAIVLDALQVFNIEDDERPVWFVAFSKLLYTGSYVPDHLIAVEPRPFLDEYQHGLKNCCNIIIKEEKMKLLSSNETIKDKGVRHDFFALDNRMWNLYATASLNNTIEPKEHFWNILNNYPLNSQVGNEIVYNIVTIVEPPYTIIHERSSVMYNSQDNKCEIGKVCWQHVSNHTDKMEPFCCIGFLMDMLDLLEKDLNFNSYIYLVEDGKYGEVVNSTWVGLVGDLVKEKAHIVLASLTINEKRAEVVDYSLPFLVGGMSLITRLKKELIPFINFEPFKSLSPTLWIATLFIIFGASFLLVVTDASTGRRKYEWRESITYLAGLLFQRDIGGKNPHNLSTKTISITIAIFTMVIMSTYTAVLTANNVTHRQLLPVKDFKDPKITNPTSAFKFGTLANSAYSQIFKDSNDSVWNRIHLFTKQYHFTDTNLAFEKLNNGELDAIIHDYYIAYHHIAKDPECQIQFAGPPIKDGGSGIAVQKGSPLRYKISERITKYQSKDVLIDLQNRWMKNQCVETKKSGTAIKVGIEYFGGLFLFLFGALFLSVIVFFIEVTVSKYQRRKRRSYNVEIYCL